MAKDWRAVLFDTIIQHGDGDPPRTTARYHPGSSSPRPDQVGNYDSIRNLLNLVKQEYGTVNQSEWIRFFLKERKRDLLRSDNPETRAEWHDSAPRTDKFQALLEAGNLDLHTPMTLIWNGGEPEDPQDRDQRFTIKWPAQ